MVDNIGGRRWWAAAALAVSGAVIGIDATVLSLALPTLATDLHASTAQLQWFVDAYLLVLGAMMLPAGLLGDRFGRKRLLLAALALFGLGSLACAYASSAGQLIAARTVLGLAAAFVLPLSLSVLPVLFDEHERQRALAIVASSAIASYPIGPILGGWLLTQFWWGSVFLINVPVIALALLAVTFLMPESHPMSQSHPMPQSHPISESHPMPESSSAARPRLDPLGVLLSTAGLVALTYGVIRAGDHGWGDRNAMVFMVAGALVLVGFVGWERHVARSGSRQPLVDLDLFRSASFRWGTILSTLLSFALIGLIFAVPQYFRAVLGYDAMGAGLRLLPLIGGMIMGLAAGDRISAKVGPKIAVVIGFAVAAVALIIAASTSRSDGTGFAATWLAIGGIGTGIALPPAINAALGRLTGERSGVGSGLISAARQVGGTLGVAVLGSVLNSAYRGQLHLDGLPSQASDAVRDNVAAGVAVARHLGSADLLAMVEGAFVHGMDVMFAWSAGIAAAAAVLALVFLPGPARRPVEPPTSAPSEPTQAPTPV
jgi:MFS transporter, DHA2 family, multidrug resistance protein